MCGGRGGLRVHLWGKIEQLAFARAGSFCAFAPPGSPNGQRGLEAMGQEEALLFLLPWVSPPPECGLFK